MSRVRQVAVASFALAILASTSMVAGPRVGTDDTAADIRLETFFSRLNRQPDNYARLRYARRQQAGTDKRLRSAIDQVLATELSRFGRLGEAEARFPHDLPRDPQGPLPTAGAWQAMPAVDYVAAAAAGRRVVIVNEAHHRPATRLLSLALLPRLREMGFSHLAVEGLDPADTALAQRRYPVEASGYYIGEPLYGELVRDALRLGYTLVAYEPADSGRLTQQERETAQAQALQQVLDADPDARVLVHAGYAHADKFPGQLPMGTLPMAYELTRLTGIEPLSIDQTILAHGHFLAPGSPYRRLLSTFPVEVPSVLVARADGHPWSYRTQYHDATVLLPAAAAAPPLRPAWLGLQGRRRAVAIDASACKGVFPCLFAARYASEGNDAVPADQFVLFSANDAKWPLYLAPARYRLEVRGDSGQVLDRRPLVVEAAPGLHTGAAGATMGLPLQPRTGS